MERIRSLEKKLREGLEAIDRTAAEVKEDVERLRDVHAEVAGKFNEAKKAKDFEKERTRQGPRGAHRDQKLLNEWPLKLGMQLGTLAQRSLFLTF